MGSIAALLFLIISRNITSSTMKIKKYIMAACWAVWFATFLLTTQTFFHCMCSALHIQVTDSALLLHKHKTYLMIIITQIR